MEGFITWKILTEYVSFISATFMVVEFCKNLPIINKIPTKYFSAIISFILLTIVNIHNNTFTLIDFTLYILSSISISLGSNGLYDFHNRSDNDSKNNGDINL